MRKTILFIAMSLDGFIADSAGQVDWLSGQNPAEDNDAAYTQFISGVDCVVMGWTTYHQIVAELSPSVWVYDGLTSHVITHREIPSTPQIRFTQESPAALIRRLQAQNGKDIWVCGGADIVRQLMSENLIDRFHISIIPVILGDGIRLFAPLDVPLKLRLIECKAQNGITEVIYERR